MYPSQSSLHQRLESILNLFSKAGVSVVEFREYTFFVDVVIDKPIGSETFRKIYIELLNAHNVLAFQLKSENL